MEDIFFDKKLQKKFEKFGYVKLQILPEKKADLLFKLYQKTSSLHKDNSNSFHSTSDTGNKDLIKKVSTEITKVFMENLSDKISNIESLIGNFQIKEPQTDSFVAAHQDWTFVDESKFFSANIWVGLEDIGTKDGCMFFLPKSHNFKNSLRVSPVYKSFYESYREKIPPFCKYYPTKKGEGFIFNHAVIHGSTENQTQKARLAAVMGIYSKRASLKHYYLNNIESNQVDQYSIEANDLFYLKKNLPPSGKNPIKTITFDFKELDFNLFQKKYFSKMQLFKNKLNKLI